ncbi:hypothetical protein As57867_020765, partial [Aphanomyces stellatus]
VVGIALTTVDVTPPQSVEKALGLAYVEVGSLVLLQHATSSPSTDSHTTALLLSVVDVMWAYHSSQPAVDRSMSSIVVRYFPGLALLSLDAAQATKLMTIALAWLAAEDSLRWIVVDSKDASCLLVDALILLHLHNRPQMNAIWKLEAVAASVARHLRDPDVPLRLFAKTLYLLFLVCNVSTTDTIRPVLHLLLDPELTTERTAATKATVWDEWDNENPVAATTSSKEGLVVGLGLKQKCLSDFWRDFDAQSAGQQRISDLVATACSPNERLRLQA